MAIPTTSSTPEGSVVVVSLLCSRCRYELRGLPAAGVCPECGLPVDSTLIHSTDPAASHLPKLHDPRAVGQALLLIVGSGTLAAFLVAAGPLARWLDGLDPNQLRNFGRLTPQGLGLVASAVAASGLYGVFRLTPARGIQDRVGRDVRRIGVAIAIWALLLAGNYLRHRVGGGPSLAEHLLLPIAMGLAVNYGLIGLRGVLQTVGQRSRVFRRAQGGRQRIRGIIAAVWGVLGGRFIQIGADTLGWEPVVWIGLVLTAISALMLFIGLVYLLANVSWIRQALRRPAPSLADLLGERLASATTVLIGPDEIAAAEPFGVDGGIDGSDPPPSEPSSG